MAHNDRAQQIGSLLATLVGEGLASRTRVFGSVMKGDASARDLDCVLDLDTPVFSGVVFPPDGDTSAAAKASLAQQPILARCLGLRRDSAFQGPERPLLNCFVRLNGHILEPNISSTWWRSSPVGPSIWDKALVRGVSLDRIVWPPVQVNRSK
jgi:hypothetical protein